MKKRVPVGGLRKRAILRGGEADLLLKEWRPHGHIHENYSGDTGMGCDKDNSDPFYHRSGLLAYIAIDHDGQP